LGSKPYNYVKHWRYKSNQMAMDAFGHKCGICGYNKCDRALCFHHLDPEKKETDFGGICQSWYKMVKDLRKCVLLCANCHMEVHDNITHIPKDIKKFNENFAVYTNSQGRIIGKAP